MTNSHCRLCAEIKLNTDLVEINKDSVTFNFYYKIYQFFQIHIEDDDILPKSVCLNCCDQVIRTQEFNEKVQKAQDILRSIYIQLEDKDVKDNWNSADSSEQHSNFEPSVKVEEKDDYIDDFTSHFDNADNSESDTKDDNDQLISAPSSKTKIYKKNKTKKIKKTCKKKSDTEALKLKNSSRKSRRPVLKEWNDFLWRCNSCSADFESVNALRVHYEKRHNKPPEYTCMMCSKIETNYSVFRKHVLRYHINRYKFRCEVCGKYCNSKWAFTQHCIRHSDIRKFVCAQCGKSFKRQKTLELHGQMHLPIELKQFHECDICHKKYNTAAGLTCHQEVHFDDLKDTEAVCEQCGKAFKTKLSYMLHMKTHVVGTPFSCDQCHKSYKSNGSLHKHKINIHSEVIFKCDICERKLGSQNSLREHKLRHSNHYPHVCNYCKKGFRYKYELTIHLRQHTGERPYSCLECKHYFTNDSNFIKHLRGRHKLKNFSVVNNHSYPFVNPMVSVVKRTI